MFRTVPFFVFVVWFAGCFAGALGWVLNIVKILGMDFDPNNISMMLVLRLIGVIVAPLGAVLGYI